MQCKTHIIKLIKYNDTHAPLLKGKITQYTYPEISPVCDKCNLQPLFIIMHYCMFQE